MPQKWGWQMPGWQMQHNLLDTYFIITALCPKRPFLCGALCSCRPESTAVCFFALSFLTEFVHSPYIHPQFWQWRTWNIEFIYIRCAFLRLWLRFPSADCFDISRRLISWSANYQVVVIKLIFLWYVLLSTKKTLQYVIMCSTTKTCFDNISDKCQILGMRDHCTSCLSMVRVFRDLSQLITHTEPIKKQCCKLFLTSILDHAIS